MQAIAAARRPSRASGINRDWYRSDLDPLPRDEHHPSRPRRTPALVLQYPTHTCSAVHAWAHEQTYGLATKTQRSSHSVIAAELRYRANFVGSVVAADACSRVDQACKNRPFHWSCKALAHYVNIVGTKMAAARGELCSRLTLPGHRNAPPLACAPASRRVWRMKGRRMGEVPPLNGTGHLRTCWKISRAQHARERSAS